MAATAARRPLNVTQELVLMIALIAAIGSALIFVNISPYWLRAVQGVLILLTVLADLWRRQRQARGL